MAEALGYDIRSINGYENGRAQIPLVVTWAMRGLEVSRTNRRKAMVATAAHFAVYTEAAVFGVGETKERAYLDAGQWLDQTLPTEDRERLIDSMKVAPATPRLVEAVHAEGGDLAFDLRQDGVLDLPD